MDQGSNVVERVIAEVGSAAKLAAELGITGAAVGLWKKTGSIPAERVIACERASGVPRQEIRPDLYPD